MSTLKNTDSSKQVTEYIQKLDPVLSELASAIRKVILRADKEIGEHIKWNAPAFYYTGSMKEFDAKEYKRDLVVFNLHKRNHVLLIFPTGASVSGISDILEGDFKDGRRMVTILDKKDLKSKEKELIVIIQQWLKQIDK